MEATLNILQDECILETKRVYFPCSTKLITHVSTFIQHAEDFLIIVGKRYPSSLVAPPYRGEGV
jgi:hypothetical protein